MAANTSLDLVSLDYDAVKQSLRSFLAADPTFKSYDFDQGGLAAILKVLAYDAFNSNWLLNMTAAESFIDSAQLMTSMASHAKELGYLAGSAASARARVRMSWSGPSPVYYLQKGQTFTGLVRGAGSVSFSVPSTTTVTGSNGSFTVDLDVYEGAYVSDAWVVNSADPTLRYTLTNQDVDASSASVVVYEGGSSVPTAYARASTLLGLDENSRVWFMQMSETGRYEVLLGDGVSGYLPPDGSRLVADYRVTKGEAGNGVSRLTAAFVPYPGDATGVTTDVLDASSGGSAAESVDSVRFRAPRHFRVQERAVSAPDYAIMLTEQFPEIRAAVATGGEDLSPPQFGRVVVSVDLSDADAMSDSRRAEYEAFLLARASLTVRPRVVDPDRAWVSLSCRAWYDSGLSPVTPDSVRAAVAAAAQQWCASSLGGFDGRLAVSRLQAAIDASDASVVSNEVEYSVYKMAYPRRGVASRLSARMGFPLARSASVSYASDPAVSYTVWTAPLTWAGTQAFVAEDGAGNLRLVRAGRFGAVVGGVDYDSGAIDVPSAQVDDYAGSGLRVYARPRDPDYLVPGSGTVLALGDELTVSVIPTAS